MMTDEQHPLVSEYLRHLRALATLRLPADRADELVADIRDHLRERIPADATEADVRNVVDRMGTPTELVDEAGGSTTSAYAGPPAPAPAPGNGRDMAALVMLVLSVVTAIVFPVAGLLLIAGLVLTFMSPRWRGSDKALAMVVYTVLGMPLVVLGGLAAVMTTSTVGCSQEMTADGTTAGAEICTSSGLTLPPWLLLVIGVSLLGIHVYTASRLFRQARATPVVA